MHSFKIWNKIFEDREIIVEKEDWNKEYEGLNISSGNFNFKSRLAKKTPKKPGYFVAIWKKDSLNKNIPFNEDDIGDYLVINILDDYNEGQFVFPVSILIEKGIVKADNSKGKMAFRLYPPWFKDLNKAAMVSQKWQSEYFYKMGEYKFE